MKSKSKKSDKKSTVSRGQGSAQQRCVTSGVRTPSPPHDPTPSTAVVTSDISPLLPGGNSLTVRIASTNCDRKSCEPTGNGRLLREESEVTGSEPVATSLVLAGDSDAAPEVVEGPEGKEGLMSVEGSGGGNINHRILPIKRMKMMNRETQPSSSTSSAAERCNAGVLTDPDCLGPCDPGSSVILEGIVWNESRNGLLVVNVTWRGKTYVGTLMDSTNHHWASPSFKEDSLSNDNNPSSSRDEDGAVMAPEGRRLRRCRTAQPSTAVMATASTTSSSSASTTSTSSKTSTSRTKCRIPVGDLSVQTDPVNLQQTLNGSGGGDVGVLCPELHCQRKFKHEAALRNHRFRAHKATDSIATSPFVTTSAAGAAAASVARSIVNDSGGNPLTTEGKGPSLLLQTKQKPFDGDEDVSSVNGSGRVSKKTEDGGGDARLCSEKDDESMEADCPPLNKSASWMENDKLNCFVPSGCLQSTPIVTSGSIQSSSAKLPISTDMEKGVADATLNSSDCPASESAAPMCDGVESITGCADRQKMRNGAKKRCKGKPDRLQRNFETVVSSAGLASQMFGQSLGTACAVAEPANVGAVLLQGVEDKHSSAKRLKTNGDIPLSMLSVSLNRIPMDNDSSLARKTASATESRNYDRLQDAERNGSFSAAGADSTVRGLGLDVAKLCIASAYGTCAGREPSAAETPSQSLLTTRQAMERCHSEKTQADNYSNCHPVVPAVKLGNTLDEEIAKPALESCLVLPGKGQNGNDSQTCGERELTPSLLVFRSSKNCADKILAPGIVCDGNQKQTGPQSDTSLMFAADSSKSLLDHDRKESFSGSHVAFMEKRKPESTNFTKGIKNSNVCVRTSAVENIGNQTIKPKCASFSNLGQALADRVIATSAAPPGGTMLIGSGPTPYAKDMLCDLNSFTSIQKDFSDLKGVMRSRSTIPFAVPPGLRSIPNGSLTWTKSPFVSSISSLQHTTGSNTSSTDPQISRGSTFITPLASSMSSSSLTPDCSFIPFCRAIQGTPAATSLPKQMNKSCVPSPPLASSCPLEANTASEVFVRRDDGSWTSAAVGKSTQHAMISNASCTDRNLLACGAVSLPVPLQPPLSASSSSADLHHGGGVIPYQQRKEKLLSTLHSSAMKPQSSSSSRSLLAGHSVQAACPK